MEIIYSNSKVKKQCENVQEAKKLFRGNSGLAISLLARINALKGAEIIKDIINQPQFHFHDLHNKGRKRLDGYYAIDVKTRTDPWRIILRPLDENKNPFENSSIDEIAGVVEIVEIKEVSNHYE